MSITAFYQNAGRDIEGRSLEEIWALSDDELMHGHDWIQWLFPTAEESAFNPDAPLLSSSDITICRSHPVIQNNLRTSFYRWLKVLGLTWEDGKISGNGETWVFRTQNHNWLRFSRVIRSLSTLGLRDEAERFCAFALDHTDPTDSEDSRAYWKAALTPE